MIDELDDGLDDHLVMVGYHGSKVPVKFQGSELFSVSNQDDDANIECYHIWKLYKTAGGYRVLDIYVDGIKDIKNTQLSGEMSASALSCLCPVVVDRAIQDGILTIDEVAIDVERWDEMKEEM